jgi:hypothetical protein
MNGGTLCRLEGKEGQQVKPRPYARLYNIIDIMFVQEVIIQSCAFHNRNNNSAFIS